mmetsp:Transcript_16729/g.15088  ORF Transcript_16729/g.15088 Transcript_16729/m.15088 type:complete len:95 (+) Transcript_16729:28-312(+)
MDKEKVKAARGVDSITDYVAEKVISDPEKAMAALSSMKKTATKKEAAKLIVSEQDLTFLIKECDITRDQAYSLLKKTNGNKIESLRLFIKGVDF